MTRRPAAPLSAALPRFVSFAAIAACAFAADAGELLTLSSRADATQGVYIEASGPQPRWVVMLVPGGDGALRLSEQGATELAGNFLVRTASYWAGKDDASVLFDTPSDHAGGVKDQFRLGEDAARDVAAAVSAMRKRYPDARVALLGTSRGTITVGNVLRRDPAAADAYVLTSPVTQANKNQPGLSGLSWPGNKASVLVVSNAHDGCGVSPFGAARRLAASNGFDFATVDSNVSRGRGGECGGGSPHGFLGIETDTLDTIRAWLGKLP